MTKINAILIGDVQPYFAILDADARLTLEIGERILSVAAAAGYERRRAPAEPPERRAIASVRFGTKLDVPAAVNKPIEGSVLFLLDLKGMGSAGTEILPLRFPPMSMSGVTLFAEVTRRHKLRLTAVGLPLPNFGCETAMPECGAQSIGIVLTWKGHDVRAYVAGEQVSGMRSAHY